MEITHGDGGIQLFAKLIERDLQLSIMTKALADGAAGQGGVALVSGPIASGKTALLHVFGDRAAAAGALFLQATGSSAEQGHAFGVMEQLLLGAELAVGDLAVAARLVDYSTSMTPEEASKDVIPKLCALLLGQARKRLVVLAVDDVQSADRHSLECLLYLARRLSTNRLVIVLVENGGLLLDNPRFRADLLRQAGCRKIRIEPLSVSGVAAWLTAERVKGDAAAKAGGAEEAAKTETGQAEPTEPTEPTGRTGRGAKVERAGASGHSAKAGRTEPAEAAEATGRRTRPPAADWHRLSGGNPLVLRALLEDFDGARAAGGLVPGAAFAQAITTCLYRTDAATRRVAQGAAVLGPKAPQATLAELLGTTHESVCRCLGALSEAGLMAADWFRDEAARAAVLHTMEPPERARLEARAAEVLYDRGETATELARHLIAGEPIDAQWVLPTLLAAAERALADDEVELALDCLRAARNASTDERQILSIKTALIRAGWRVKPSLAARHLPELTAAALDGRLDGRHVSTLICYLLWFGQVDQALDVFDAIDARVASETASSAPAATSASSTSSLSATSAPGFDFLRMVLAYGYPGLPRRGDAGAGAGSGAGSDFGFGFGFGSVGSGSVGSGSVGSGSVAETVSSAQRPQPRLMALLGALLARGNGEGDDPVLLAERILQGARLDDRSVPTIVAALVALVFADGLGEGAAWCDSLIKESIARRAPMWQALFSSVRALFGIRQGRMDLAEESACTALTLVSHEEWGAVIAAPLAALIYAHTARGALDLAAGDLTVPVPDAAFQTPGGLLYLSARGHYYLAAGRPYAALDDFNACGDLMTKWRVDLPALIPWRTHAAQAHLALGDRTRAESLAQEELAHLGAGDYAARGVALRVLAAASDPERRPRLLTEAEGILWKHGHQFELALAIQELSRAYRELGDESRARTLARKAQRLLRRCGIAQAGPTEADVVPELQLDRRAPLPLSGAELRVATLAARGHTNRQIADQLFITVSTVEQHLTRIYRKLDVRRRTDLAGKLGVDVTVRSTGGTGGNGDGRTGTGDSGSGDSGGNGGTGTGSMRNRLYAG